MCFCGLLLLQYLLLWLKTITVSFLFLMVWGYWTHQGMKAPHSTHICQWMLTLYGKLKLLEHLTRDLTMWPELLYSMMIGFQWWAETERQKGKETETERERSGGRERQKLQRLLWTSVQKPSLSSTTFYSYEVSYEG